MKLNTHLMAGMLVSCLTLTSFGSLKALAQPDGQQAGPSPEKVQLIKDVLQAARANRNAQLGYDLALSQELKGLSAVITSRIENDQRLTPEQKTDNKRLALMALNKRMARVRQLMAEKINLTQLVSDTYLKMYDKYFSVQELKDMLQWYQSPTGQKTLDNMPKLTDESTALINAAVMPKIREISLQIIEEEKAAVKPEAAKQ